MAFRIAAVALSALLLTSVCGASLRDAGRHRGKNGGTQAQGAATEAQVRNSLGEVVELLAQMLKDFSEQATEDKQNWEDYSKWSQDLETEKRNFVQQQEALVMSTTATKNANMEMVAKLTEDLAQLAADILETEKSIAELIQMRHEEHTQFQESLTDVSQTIAAVAKATTILQGHYGASAASLAALRSRIETALVTFGSRLKPESRQGAMNFASMLQQAAGARNPDFLNADGNSQYGAYESAAGSKGVIGMLEDLQSQLEGQRNQLISTENESQLQFESTKATKDAELAHAKNEKKEKEGKKAECEATIEQCIATVDQANREIGEAQQVIAETIADREKFQKQFNERTTMRTQEQAATQAALDALQSVSAGAKSGVGELFQQAPAFIQLDGKAALRLKLTEKSRAHLGNTLQKLMLLGKELKSQQLTTMAASLKQDYMGQSQQDFFDQSKFGPVLKLLSDLIARLEAEAAAETSQHEWCENEKNGSVKSKEEREKTIHGLQGTIEGLTTNIATLKSEVEFLESEIARVKEETRIAKEIRASEKAVYTKARADHEEVIKAIALALQALGGQYGFVQLAQEHRRASGKKQTPFSSYGSGASGAGSAMEMLTDLQERYSTALREIITDEESAVKAHVELLAKNKQFVEDCTNTKNAKTSERRGLINDLSDDKAEMKVSLIELHEVGKYLMDLRPSCDDIRSTFEERTQRREAEIAALKEALSVISDPSMA